MSEKEYLGRSAAIDGLLFHWDDEQKYWIGVDKDRWVTVKVSDSEFNRWITDNLVVECVACVANGAITSEGEPHMVPVSTMMRSARI